MIEQEIVKPPLRNASIVAKVCESMGFVTEGQAAATLEATADAIKQYLSVGRSVNIRGLGTFKLAACAQRWGTNPYTKERIVIPAQYRVRFVPDETIEVPKYEETTQRPQVALAAA